MASICGLVAPSMTPRVVRAFDLHFPCSQPVSSWQGRPHVCVRSRDPRGGDGWGTGKEVCVAPIIGLVASFVSRCDVRKMYSACISHTVTLFVTSMGCPHVCMYLAHWWWAVMGGGAMCAL